MQKYTNHFLKEKSLQWKLVGWLMLYAISTLVGYLIPNPVFTYIWFVSE